MKRKKKVTNNEQVSKRVGQWIKVAFTFEIKLVQ